MRTEELLTYGAMQLETSQQLRARARTLQAWSDWNISSARALCQRRPSIAGGSDGGDPATLERIRGLLDAVGVLRGRGLTIWSGKGKGGHQCAVCRRDLPVGAIEYEIVIGNVVSVLLHRDCFDLWSSEVDQGPSSPRR